eukprot:UN03437
MKIQEVNNIMDHLLHQKFFRAEKNIQNVMFTMKSNKEKSKKYKILQPTSLSIG